MAIIQIDPVGDKRWDALVASHADATAYHSPGWARVLISTYGYQPRYLAIEASDGRLCAGLPLFKVQSWLTGRRLVCLPFSDQCWPLTSTAQEATALLGAARQLLAREHLSYLEVRGWASGQPALECGLAAHPYYLHHQLRFDGDPDRLWHSLDKRMRQAIRLAERSGVTIRVGQTAADYQAFHHLDLLTRHKHGAPPHPARLFWNIQRHMGSNGQAHLLLAEYAGKTIAGSLFLIAGDTLYCKYNASDEHYLNLRPNYALLWTGIVHGCERGCRQLDLGRSNPEHTGLREHKRRWGASEVALPYYFYPQVRGVGAVEASGFRAQAMRAILARLPTRALAWAGSFLYPHLG